MQKIIGRQDFRVKAGQMRGSSSELRARVIVTMSESPGPFASVPTFAN